MRRAALLAAGLAGCAGGGPPAGRPEPADPPTARRDMVELLREDLAAERSPADGGGRAWLEAGGPVVAGGTGRWVIGYEAGPLGIAEEGHLYLQGSPWWGWSAPQAEEPRLPGFVRATGPDGRALPARTVGPALVEIDAGGLRPGERVLVAYGAGPAGARADRFAERCSGPWLAVDGDGDGVRGVVPSRPCIEVRPGSPALLHAVLPSTAEPGEEVALRVAVLDALGNGPVPAAGTLRLEASGLDGLPAEVALSEEAGGVLVLRARARGPGLALVRASGLGAEGESNALVVRAGLPRVLWGDVHGHSALSDGTGEPADWYAWARDVAGLDFAALTDHDHWGARFLDASPDLRDTIARAAAEAGRPGRFVALWGFEWTSWIHGHRHVVSFEPPRAGWTLPSSIGDAETPAALHAALRGGRALVLRHHPAGGPIAVDWSFPLDPELEPLVEIASVHGQSSDPALPGRIYDPVDGAFARQRLEAGDRFGFAASGDGHDGHPGLAHVAGHGRGGLLGVLAENDDRDALYAAMRARRTLATTGPRLLLLAWLDGAPQGAEVPPGDGCRRLVVLAASSSPLVALEVVRPGRVEALPLPGEMRLVDLDRCTGPLADGDFLYVRARDARGAMAWASPFLVRAGAPPL